MGVDMELDFEKYCKGGLSPKISQLPPRHHPKSENRSKKDKLSTKKDLFVLQEEDCVNEIQCKNYRSISCRSLPTRDVDVESRDKVLRRASVYDCSSDRKLKRAEVGRGGRRKKIEFSLDNQSPFSFSILDSICGSDEEAESLEQECSSVMSATSRSLFSSKTSRETSSVECVNLSDRESTAKCAERDLEYPKYKYDQVVGPSSNANVLKEGDTLALHKSLSAKLALPHSPTRVDNDRLKSSSSPKSRFTPNRKMFDHLTKSKSHRSPLSSTTVDPADSRLAETANACKNKTFRKSLLQDFSSATQNSNTRCQPVKNDHHHQKQQPAQQEVASPPCSPAHLLGNLKLEHKHGVPYFEFSSTHTEEVFVAKAWKAEETFNWVYTFHSVQGRKRSSANGWGMKYSNKVSPMVGQMQVSSYLCSELRDAVAFSNSMVTEFVLYDIAHARKSSTTGKETSSASDMQVLNGAAKDSLIRDTLESGDKFDPVKLKTPITRVLEHGNLDYSSPYPLAPADLHPNLEIAAVVIQVPLEKRESLKYRRGDKVIDQMHMNLLDASLGPHRKRSSVNGDFNAKVNVVTPMGNHGLPTEESRGPSPLLDRWKLGGGCDCGGWDMACPLAVFGNHCDHVEEVVALLEKDRPLELHMQGTKDETPALTIKVTEKGHYAVIFHAQLSTLQAFAICVSVLHATEASITNEQERNKHLLQCSSLKVMVEDEVKLLIESVTKEERRKASAKPAETLPPFVVKERRKQAVKVAEENPKSFVVNPPFSPIARV